MEHTFTMIDRKDHTIHFKSDHILHKSQSLLNLMFVLASDGCIITVIGPYLVVGKQDMLLKAILKT